MKFGTQDQAFFPRDILEKFRFIKDCGFEEYEIDGKLLIENIDTVKQAIKETGIPVVTACNGYGGSVTLSKNGVLMVYVKLLRFCVH